MKYREKYTLVNRKYTLAVMEDKELSLDNDRTYYCGECSNRITITVSQSIIVTII